MTQEPQVQPLSYKARSRFFFSIVALFVLVVPFLIFYAIGYRFDFSREEGESSITRVGGMFVSSELGEVTMYIDDTLVTDMRFFQTAAYIQNLSEGKHKIVVAAEDGQTWVKELPVFPHIVTEVESFTMPATSTVRIIPRRLNDGVASVSPEAHTLFAERGVVVNNATTSTSTLATPTLTLNPEWEYLTELFAATSTVSDANEAMASFASDLTEASTSSPTSTSSATATTSLQDIRMLDDMFLVRRDEDVYALWQGRTDRVPYYFCVRQAPAADIASWYGEHVRQAVFQNGETLNETITTADDRWCRLEIKLDRLRQEVVDFAFLPGDRDHVVLHLTDGLYVGEIDDRSWQNTQQIYAGDDFEMIVDGGQIFLKEDDVLFEVITTPQN